MKLSNGFPSRMSVACKPTHDLSPVTFQTSFLSSSLPLCFFYPNHSGFCTSCSFCQNGPSSGTLVHLLMFKYCLSKGLSPTSLVKIATHSQLFTPLPLLLYLVSPHLTGCIFHESILSAILDFPLRIHFLKVRIFICC